MVVGEYGAGLHNAMFAPMGSVVISLNWINDVQSRIAQLRRQHLAFLLPSTGRPVLWSEKAAPQGYRIDPLRFEQCLRQARALTVC